MRVGTQLKSYYRTMNLSFKAARGAYFVRNN